MTTKPTPSIFSASPAEWNDWHWQLKNRLTTTAQLVEFLGISPEEAAGIEKCLSSLRMAITPYYAALIKKDDPQDPIRLQAVPRVEELAEDAAGFIDPLGEERDSPAPYLTHRYPDRALLLVTDQCAMYCRHCTRRRYAGHVDHPVPLNELEPAFEYLEKTEQIRDVLVSGGDPLTLEDERLEPILKRLRAIEHLEVIRLCTRMPVVCPQRITEELATMLRRYAPLYCHTHFNHPNELTKEARAACATLVDHGIPINNQTVLLRGVNDCPYTIKKLCHELVKNRVRPYYLFQCDLAKGNSHFRTSIAKGVEIMELLRGHTSGMAVPTYAVDLPDGGGKVFLEPNYLISMAPGKVLFRNFEGLICAYNEPENLAISEHRCTDECRAQDKCCPTGGINAILAGEKINLWPQNVKRGGGWPIGKSAKKAEKQ